jgi:hypothetical protein
MSSVMRAPSIAAIKDKQVGHRIGFLIVALLVLFTAVLLPFAVDDAFEDIVSPPAGRVYYLIRPRVQAPEHLLAHLNVTSIDVAQRSATIMLTAHQVCRASCADTFRVLIVSTLPEGPDREGVPPSVTVPIPPATNPVSQTFTLPVHGDSIRYPFDQYALGFGIVLQQQRPDGSVQSLTPADAEGRLIVTVQTHVQGIDMRAPVAVGAARIPVVGDAYPFLAVREMEFNRPLYLKVLAILLVLLVAAAAAFAVFMRPLDQLVINVGALVIGIWGVRSILVGTFGPSMTAVDLSLSMVILFLLAAITVRSLAFLDERSGIGLLRRLRPSAYRGDATESPPATPAKEATPAPVVYIPDRPEPVGSARER